MTKIPLAKIPLGSLSTRTMIPTFYAFVRRRHAKSWFHGWVPYSSHRYQHLCTAVTLQLINMTNLLHVFLLCDPIWSRQLNRRCHDESCKRQLDASNMSLSLRRRHNAIIGYIPGEREYCQQEKINLNYFLFYTMLVLLCKRALCSKLIFIGLYNINYLHTLYKEICMQNSEIIQLPFRGTFLFKMVYSKFYIILKGRTVLARSLIRLISFIV